MGDAPPPCLPREKVEVAVVMRSRIKMMSMTAGVAAVLLAVVSVAVGSMKDDAGATDSTQLRVLWADVGSDGFLNGGKGILTATKTGTGSYEVRFQQNVLACAHTATILDAPGEISLGTGAYFTLTAGNQFAGNREVAVFTRDSAGAYADRAVDVVVNCWPPSYRGVGRGNKG